MVALYRLTLILTLLSVGCIFPTLAQTVRKLERAATNRTHPTLVNGDTIQRFSTTRHRPSPKPDRMYYLQSQDHILRTMGAYNGYLLDGPYQLTDRTDRLLGSGVFKQGLKTGLWRKWRADGSLASSSRWHNGQQQGLTISYDANGQPLRLTKKAAPASVPTPSSSGLPPSSHWWQFGRRKASPATVPTAAPAAPPVGAGRAPVGKKKEREKRKKKGVGPAAPPEAVPKPGS